MPVYRVQFHGSSYLALIGVLYLQVIRRMRCALPSLAFYCLHYLWCSETAVIQRTSALSVVLDAGNSFLRDKPTFARRCFPLS